ncbi:MAG TPA: O-antigen ligase family protein [Patescibacteria group bacterium]|nr:O-antigen ligase family protein [Patescibacteria group bacterium]
MQKLSALFNKTFKYLIAALLIIVPLYPKFPFIQIPGTYVAIRAEDFLLATMAIFILVKFTPTIKKFLTDDIVRAMILFLSVGLVSFISGVLLTKTVVFNIGILHFFRRIEYFIPFFAAFAVLYDKKEKNLEFYLKVLMIVIFGAFIYGFGQRYFNFPVIITQDSESSKGLALRWTAGSQITSTFAGHYDLAAFMVLVLPIIISLYFVLENKLTKSLLLIVALSGFWLLVSTASRISLASYLISACFSLFLLKKYKGIVFVVLISIVLSGFSSNLFARYKSLIDVYSQKIMNLKIVDNNPFRFVVSAQETTLNKREATPIPAPSIPVVEDRSTSIRLNVEWPRAIRSFTKNPLIGTGYSSIGLATDNDYLRLLAEVGLLGFLAFMLIMVRIMFVFISALPLTQKFSGIELGFIAGTIGGFIGTFLNAVFIDVFEASKFAIMFWLLVGLAVYTIKNKVNEDMQNNV